MTGNLENIFESNILGDGIAIWKAASGAAGKACKKHLEHPELASREDDTHERDKLFAGIMRLYALATAANDVRVPAKVADSAQTTLRQVSLNFYDNREPNPEGLVQSLISAGIRIPTIDEIEKYYQEIPRTQWAHRVSFPPPPGGALPTV